MQLSQGLRRGVKPRYTLASACGPSPPRRTPEPPLNHDDPSSSAQPELIGPYRVLHQIGSGVLGPVFRVLAQDTSSILALKLFRLDWPPEQAHALAGALQTLIETVPPHPSIVAPLAAGLEGGTAWLAQELVEADGLDLRMRRRTAVGAEALVAVLRQVAAALDAGVAAGWRHGSLHPRDVLIDTTGRVRVTGIGVAQLVERFGARPSRRRPYAAPERVPGGPWDARADVFALAVVALEWLAPRRGRPGAEPLQDTLATAGFDGPAAVGLLAAATSASPQDRPATAMALVEALAGAIDVSRLARTRTPAPGSLFPEPGRDGADEAAADAPTIPGLERSADDTLQSDVLTAITVTESTPASAPADLALAPPAGRHHHDLVLRPDDPPAAPLEAWPHPHVPEPAVPEPAWIGPGTGQFSHASAPERPAGPADAPRGASLVDGDTGGARQFGHQPGLDASSESRLDAVFETGGPDAYQAGVPATAGTPYERFAPGAGGGRRGSRPLPPQRVPSLRQWGVALAAVLLVGLGMGFVLGRWSVSPLPPGPSATAAPPASTPPAVTVTGNEAVRPEPEVRGAPPAPAPAPAAAPAPGPATARPAPAASAGRVTVHSTPAGARVQVDGRDRGRTPVTIGGLGVGRHLVEVSRDGYADQARRVEITATRPSVTLDLRLEATAAPGAAAAAPVTAALEFVTRPAGAGVYVDGRRVGVSPLKIDGVAPGARTIRFELAGHAPWTSTITLAAGESRRVTASLEQRR